MHVVIPGVSFHNFEDSQDKQLWRSALTEAVAEICSLSDDSITILHAKDASPELLVQTSRRLLRNIGDIDVAVRADVAVRLTTHSMATVNTALRRLQAAEASDGPDSLTTVLQKFAALHHLDFRRIGSIKAVLPHEGSPEAEHPAGSAAPPQQATPTPPPEVVAPTVAPTAAAPVPPAPRGTVNEGDLEDVIKHATEANPTPAPSPAEVPLPPQGNGATPAPTPITAPPAPAPAESTPQESDSGAADVPTVSPHIKGGSITKPIAGGAGFVPWKGSDILGRGQHAEVASSVARVQDLQTAEHMPPHGADGIVPEEEQGEGRVLHGRWLGAA